ncbi:hypothetical protein EDD85DRAFT_798822 [Armillaria nabsnona]|nr:hypothetical protein EDD85DRAFT_798822 [Armillaria nabsnona]
MSSVSTPFSEALTTLRYCLLYDAKSSDAAMHSDAWIRAVFVAWNCLHDGWLHDEEGFLEEQEWFDMEGQLWIMLGRLDYDRINDSCKEFNALAAEALKCGILIKPMEMESESDSEAVPPSAQNLESPPLQNPESRLSTPPAPEPEAAPVPKLSPGPQDMIPPMPHTLTPESESSLPVAPPPKKYKFGPQNINDGPSFGLRCKQVEIQVPLLPTEFHAPSARIPSPSPSPPVASSSRLCKRVLSSDEEQASPSKFRRQAPSPPHLTREQKQKGHAPAPLAPKTLTGRPRKVKEETAVVVCKRGGLGEPVPKNARVVASEDLCPMGLLVPDQDFGDYVGCQGAFFKRELAGKVGHFMSVPCNACSKAHAQCCSVRSGSAKCFRCTIHKHDCVVKNQPYVNTLEPVFVPETPLVTEIQGFLKRLCQEGRQMNNSDSNIPSLFLASHLDNIELVSELFKKGVVEGEVLLDMEAEEAGSDEDLDMEREEDELQSDE